MGNTKLCSKCSHKAGLAKQREIERKINPRFTGDRKSYLPSSTLGALSESRACADLLRLGYEVFRAVSPAATCDLVIMKKDRLLRAEVKPSYYLRDGKTIRRAKIGGHTDVVIWVLDDKLIYGAVAGGGAMYWSGRL